MLRLDNNSAVINDLMYHVDIGIIKIEAEKQVHADLEFFFAFWVLNPKQIVRRYWEGKHTWIT